MNKTVSIFGLGYIGLPTAAMFANAGLNVIGIDINENIVTTINAGKIHIVEPGLEELVRKVINNGQLKATTKAVAADVFIIAVPTPFVKDSKVGDPQPDLSFIKNACVEIGKVIKPGNLVLLESTSPVGTTEKVLNWLYEYSDSLIQDADHMNKPPISVAHCPERVLPGRVLEELVTNDRIIGGITDSCATKAKELYNSFVKGQLVVTNARTAEMTKLTENASRDIQIAFANELSLICEKLEIDVWELIELANRHPRVNILQPGPGVGGHCIAVDPWFIISQAPEVSSLTRTAREVNTRKPYWVIDKVKAAVEQHIALHPEKSRSEIKISIYGLAFKADIDDLRESPALFIMSEISNSIDCNIMAVEPNINDEYICGVQIVPQEYADLNSDIAVLLVDHKEFRSSDRPKAGALIDTKGIWRT